MGGTVMERQEHSLIGKINQSIRANKQSPVTVVAGYMKIDGVLKAEKYSGRQMTGAEAYTDVILYRQTPKGIKKFNLSLKGDKTPSLALSGMESLNLVVPGLIKRFMKIVHHQLKVKLSPDDKVPDIYGKITQRDKLKIVAGTQATGGPIDYVYVGPMSVSGTYDPKTNEITFNGSIFKAEDYATNRPLYFRLRARRSDQLFDPKSVDKDGTPKIYGVSPSKGDSAGRIVITDKVPAKAMTVIL